MPDTPTQVALLYHFCRLRLPRVALPAAVFARRLDDVLSRHLDPARRREDGSPAPSREAFLENLHALDFFLACACIERQQSAWESLFAARADRTDTLLVDALRKRALRLFPRDPERQDEAVQDYWGYLLAGEREGTTPILGRYDGQRPLVPWLIIVFQNRVLSELRKDRGDAPLPDEDMAVAPALPPDEDARWHHAFRDAAREWIASLSSQEVLLLGLRLRYRLSQREVASVIGIHEGNVSKKIDAVSRRCHEEVGAAMRAMGWTGDDLYRFIHKEMAGLLLDEPRLAADRLAALLASGGKPVPALPEADGNE